MTERLRTMHNEARHCVRCIYNTGVDPDLFFNARGICNHCVAHDRMFDSLQERRGDAALTEMLAAVKSAGQGKRYDCVIGVSGGCDSSYVAYLVKKFGLRPLAVHCDNGWNTELAVANIHNVVNGLGIDLHTHVIDWDEFKDLQLAYIKASVIDIELPSDHAIMATLYRTAAKFGVKYIISGENYTTEGTLPESWVYLKNDLINLRAIHKRFGRVPLKTFPTLGYARQMRYEKLSGIRRVHLLDYVPYVKESAKQLLTHELQWRDYGGKHYESVITRFYQSYILPRKFGVDKRIAHYSSLVCSGQMTRDEAQEAVQQAPYDVEKIASDRRYVLKKLGLTDPEFEQIMNMPPRAHTDFPNLNDSLSALRPVINVYKRLTGRPTRYAVIRPRSIAMLLDNPFERDYRVYLEATTLAKHYDVTVYALKAAHLPETDFVDGVKVRRVFEPDIYRLQFRHLLNRHARRIARRGYDVLHAHDHLMLGLAHSIKKLQPDCKVIYDSHELFHSWPLNTLDRRLSIRIKTFVTRRVDVLLEKLNSSAIDALVTVNRSLADNLQAYFKLKRPAVVLRNTRPLRTVQPGRHLLRQKLSIPDSQRILVFIGMHVYPRTLNLEMVMDQVGNRDGIAFVMICKPDHNRDTVSAYAKAHGYRNIHFHDLLKPDEMDDYLCDCDAGLVSTWNKKDLSYWYALDTKLFNYTMAELPVLITAQPEYKAFVEEYQTGVCINPEINDAFYNGFREVIQNRDAYVANARKAKLDLNWENESKKLTALYASLIKTAEMTKPESSAVTR